MAYFDTYRSILSFIDRFLMHFRIEIIRGIKTMEPIRLKLRRWILGEEKYMPDSIKELFIAEEGFRLRPETITVLSELFVNTDKEFAYGLTRKFFKKIYKKAGYIQTPKDKEDFYNEGPYRRKVEIDKNIRSDYCIVEPKS